MNQIDDFLSGFKRILDSEEKFSFKNTKPRYKQGCFCHLCRIEKMNDPDFISRIIAQQAAQELMEEPMSDNINHPEHYQAESGMEVIDVIEAFELNYNLGNAIKYILRAGKKDDECQDLKKALWYLKREIKSIELDQEDDE